MRKLILHLPLCMLFANLVAQNPEACLRTYELLKSPTLTQLEELVPGTIVYLSVPYVEALRAGVFDREVSGIRHYEYLRPGTREELREGLGLQAAEVQVLAADGNVYKEVQAKPGQHFFKPKRGFHGDYQPEWRDPFLHVPAGMDPVDLRNADGQPLRVLEFQPGFLRLRAGSEEWVFFTGYPDLPFVIDTERVRARLSEKQRLANALLGQEYLIELNQTLRFLPGMAEKPQTFGPEIRHLELRVEEVFVDHQKVLLGYGEPRNYLVLDQDSDAKLYELPCLRESYQRALLADPGRLEASNQQLNRVMLAQVPVAEWSQDLALVQALESRFRLQQDDRASFRWYEHLLLLRDDLYRQTFLTARLREDGQCHVQSQYSSKRGLYHTRIQVESGREPLESNRIATLDPRSSRQRIGEWTVEKVSFDDAMDRPLLIALAAQPEQPVRVRYVAGGSFYEEIELSPFYREIIRDVYLMSELIRYRAGDR